MDWDNPLIFGESPPLPEDISLFKASLQNPTSVHLMMLRGEIATPSFEHFMHLFADKFNPLLSISREHKVPDDKCISWAADYINWCEGNNGD